MRNILLCVAAVGSVCLSLFPACGGSNGGSSSGGDAGADGGIQRRPDAGGSSSGGDAGASGGAVGPQGMQIVGSPTAYLEGVTDDGYAIYQDTSSNALYAVSVATPNAQPMTITMQGTDYMGGGGAPVVVGNSVLMVSGLRPTSQVGKLTAWTAASGTKQLSLASGGTTFALDVTDDGSKVAFYDNVTESGGALGTGDLYVSNIDGTGKTLLASGIKLEGGMCQMAAAELLFVGADLVALSCPADSASDGGTSSGGVADGGDDGGGPSGPPETITLYSGTSSWAPSTLTSDVASGGSFGSDRRAGKPGTRLLFQTQEGTLVDYVVASKTPTTIASVPVWTASYSTDASQVLYVAMTGSVSTVPVTGGTATLLASGRFNYLVGESPDSKYALVATSEVRDPMSGGVNSSDMYLMSTTAPNTPNALTTMATAEPYGQAFTADSNYAMFDENVGGYVGTLVAQPTSGSGTLVQLGTNSWIDSEPTGSLVVFNANCANCSTLYLPGQADIEYVDLSKGTTPTLLVTQADYNFYLTKDKSKLVYSWHPTATDADAGAPSAAGVWIWPLP